MHFEQFSIEGIRLRKLTDVENCLFIFVSRLPFLITNYLISHLACFRRALAGKRVAPHWVRRTLTCERVEDCQAECGLEKRFSCEGFNYRLDPTGQGQGICELIDVPLAEMDIYSSPSRRDENLLYHPDYDYYERDRNACRPSFCKDCGSIPTGGGGGGKPYLPRPQSPPSNKYFPDSPSTYSDSSHSTNDEHDRGSSHSGGKPYLPAPDYNTHPTTYRPIDNYKPFSDNRPTHNYHGSDRFQPPPPPPPSSYENTAIDKYRPPYEPSYPSYEHRPPPPSSHNYNYDRYDVSNHHYSSSVYRAPPYELDRYDLVKPPVDRPIYSEISIYEGPPPFSRPSSYPPDDDYHHRPPLPPPSSSNEYLGPYKPGNEPSYSSFGYRPKKPERPPPSPPQPPTHNYLDRERESPGPYKPKPTQSQPYIPYSINKETGSWASYGGSYGGSHNYNQQANDFWGLSNDNKRNDIHFNYFNLGNGQKYNPNENSVLSYPGSRYDLDKHHENDKDKSYYGSLWTRRPGQDGN